MLKVCPFCKNTIETGTVKCPHCTRTLVEKISVAKKPENFYSYTAIKKEGKFDSVLKKAKLLINKLPHFKTYGVFAVIVILVFVLYPYLSQNQITQPATQRPVTIITNPIVQQLQAQRAVAQLSPNKIPVSLNNGTVLTKNAVFFKGLGKLDIDNGTGTDAVAKLINTLNNKSVFTVYIKANSRYTISNIRDGVYRLVFNLGQDWDKENKKFLQNNSYSIFEENFDFVTTQYSDDEYEHTRYATFKVTLNPVLGGTAQTDDINPAEFDNY